MEPVDAFGLSVKLYWREQGHVYRRNDQAKEQGRA